MVIICRYQTAIEMLQNLNQIIKALKLPINQVSTYIQEDQILQQLISIIINIKTEITKTNTIASDILQEEEGYKQIQKQLQRQQNLNRNLIKKQLQFKEYQKCLMEQLDEQKSLTRNLKKQLNKYNEVIQNKEIQMALLSNQKKLMSKQKEIDKKIHRQSQKKVNRDKKTKEILGIQHYFNQYTINQFYKNEKAGVKPGGHQRRRSDEIIKRPATAGLKKKSVPKK